MKNKTLNLYLKANRKASREAEIEAFGHPLPKHKVHKSKKIYNRKKNKAGQNDLPFFVIAIFPLFFIHFKKMIYMPCFIVIIISNFIDSFFITYYYDNNRINHFK